MRNPCCSRPLVLLVWILLSYESAVSSETESKETEAAKSDVPVRMITKEELALHDGNQTETLWLSIMSKVYDVTKGPEYYAEGAPYHIFVGRDGNVPFITGAFNPDEAEKSLTELTPHNLMNLETWVDFYEKEEKYHFVGLLIGDLYNEKGETTETYAKVQEMIAQARVDAERQKKKREELLARRRQEAAEKKKEKELQDEQQQKTADAPAKDPTIIPGEEL